MSAEKDAGLAAFSQGDTPAAISALEVAFNADPNDYETCLNLGRAYGLSNRHDDSVSLLTQAVTIQPANAQARYNLGVALDHAGWKEQAVTVLQQAVQLQPFYPKASETIRRIQGEMMPVPQLPVPQPAAAVSPLAAPLTTLNAPPPASPFAAPLTTLNAPPPASPFAAPLTTLNALTPASPAQMPLGADMLPHPTFKPTANFTQTAFKSTPSEPSLAIPILVGIGLILACGFGFGFASVVMGFRIPLLTLAIGYILGYAVLKASGGFQGAVMGIIAAICATLAAGLGLLIMFLNNIILSPFAYILLVYAGFRAFKIASGN